MDTRPDMNVISLPDCPGIARSWMLDAMLPLWAGQGVAASGRFAYRLSQQHRFLPTPTTRARVQARQIYVFASALEMGWASERVATLISIGLRALEKGPLHERHDWSSDFNGDRRAGDGWR